MESGRSRWQRHQRTQGARGECWPSSSAGIFLLVCGVKRSEEKAVKWQQCCCIFFGSGAWYTVRNGANAGIFILMSSNAMPATEISFADHIQTWYHFDGGKSSQVHIKGEGINDQNDVVLPQFWLAGTISTAHNSDAYIGHTHSTTFHGYILQTVESLHTPLQLPKIPYSKLLAYTQQKKSWLRLSSTSKLVLHQITCRRNLALLWCINDLLLVAQLEISY